MQLQFYSKNSFNPNPPIWSIKNYLNNLEITWSWVHANFNINTPSRDKCDKLWYNAYKTSIYPIQQKRVNYFIYRNMKHRQILVLKWYIHSKETFNEKVQNFKHLVVS